MDKLTIYSVQTGEPVVVIGAKDGGLVVLDGDPAAIQKYGLDKFDSLDQIYRHVNGRSSQLRAVSDEEEAKALPPEGQNDGQAASAPDQEMANPEDMKAQMIATEDLDKRIKPSLKILDDLIRLLKQKRKQETIADDEEEKLKLEQQNAQIVAKQPETLFMAYDGDNIGNKVAQTELKDDEKGAKDVSRRIIAGQDAITAWAMQIGGTVVQSGGDEGIIKIPSTALDQVEDVRKQYAKIVEATLTIGIGSKMSEAIKARELGKLQGKNRTVMFDAGTEKELQLRVNNKGDETQASKIKEAGLAPEPKPQEEAPTPEPENDEDQQFQQYQDWREQKGSQIQNQAPEPDKPGVNPTRNDFRNVPEHIKDRNLAMRQRARQLQKTYGHDANFLQKLGASFGSAPEDDAGVQ